jgi:hypothetical protein
MGGIATPTLTAKRPHWCQACRGRRRTLPAEQLEAEPGGMDRRLGVERHQACGELIEPVAVTTRDVTLRRSSGPNTRSIQRGEALVRSIVRGLGARTLACGCVIGLYETYDGRAIAIVDVRGTECNNPRHRLNGEIDIAETVATPGVPSSTNND